MTLFGKAGLSLKALNWSLGFLGISMLTTILVWVTNENTIRQEALPIEENAFSALFYIGIIYHGVASFGMASLLKQREKNLNDLKRNGLGNTSQDEFSEPDFYSNAEFKEIISQQALKDVDTNIPSSSKWFTRINYIFLFASIFCILERPSTKQLPHIRFIYTIETLLPIGASVVFLVAKSTLRSKIQWISLALYSVAGLLSFLLDVIYQNQHFDLRHQDAQRIINTLEVPTGDLPIYVCLHSLLMVYFCVTSYKLAKLMKERENILPNVNNKKFI